MLSKKTNFRIRVSEDAINSQVWIPFWLLGHLSTHVGMWIIQPRCHAAIYNQHDLNRTPCREFLGARAFFNCALFSGCPQSPVQHIDAKTKWPPFADDVFKFVFFKWKLLDYMIQISFKFISSGPISNKPKSQKLAMCHPLNRWWLKHWLIHTMS